MWTGEENVIERGGYEPCTWYMIDKCLPPCDAECVLVSDTGFTKLWYRRSIDYMEMVKQRAAKIMIKEHSLGIWDEDGLPMLRDWQGKRWQFWMWIPSPVKDKSIFRN